MEMSLEDSLDALDTKFDAIVLADVLEHCADPWTQLSRLVTLGKPDSKIVISLPNVAHILVRLMLLTGHFHYADRGIMDRTHLRFFTRRTAMELVEYADLVLESVEVTPTPLELKFPRMMTGAWGQLILGANARLSKVVPRLLGYQFVLVCRAPTHSTLV
jgi:hypothetical protein